MKTLGVLLSKRLNHDNAYTCTRIFFYYYFCYSSFSFFYSCFVSGFCFFFFSPLLFDGTIICGVVTRLRVLRAFVAPYWFTTQVYVMWCAVTVTARHSREFQWDNPFLFLSLPLSNIIAHVSAVPYRARRRRRSATGIRRAFGAVALPSGFELEIPRRNARPPRFPALSRRQLQPNPSVGTWSR